MTSQGDAWSMLIPVKRLDLAKSRLELAADLRPEIALAMAIDTVSAALAAAGVGEVVVITDDPTATETLAALGADVVADHPDAGLNPALTHGASRARYGRVAALSSDLPSLRAEDLAAVLRAAVTHPLTVVADAVGNGTTWLGATDRAVFRPAFGIDSLAAHRAAGAVDLTTAAAPSMRQDVDTVAALRAAVDLGVGPATAATLKRLSPHLG